MASVKICDRCGKEIKPVLWPVLLRNYRSILRFEVQDYIYNYDLCGECTKSLYEFVKNGITEGSTEENK